MLQAVHTGLNGLLQLIGQAWPPEALSQERQGMIMSLMTYIPMAPIECGDMMGPRDQKRAEDPQSHLWALSAGTRPLVEL